MATYTIQNAMETGETHETYGTEYFVKFKEDAGTHKLWFKSKPEEGHTVDGHIEEGKYGPRFKKDKKPFVDTKDSKGEEAPRSFGAQQADRSDGMRQGMCMNNAANFVNATVEATGVTLTPTEWAEMVWQYANALYGRGDLTGQAPVPEQLPLEEAATVKEVFGIK